MTESKPHRPINSRKLFLVRSLVVAGLVLLAAKVRATLYLSEPFDYPVANLSTATPWSGAGSNLKLIAGNLTNVGLVDFTPTTNSKAQGLGSAADGKRTFNTTAIGGPAVGGSVYVSFALRQTTLAASSGPLLALSDATSVGSGGLGALVVYLNKSGSQFQIGIKKNGSAVQYPATGTYTVNDTVLVVARYKFNTGSTTDDTVTLWINPLVNGVEPAPGTSGIAETTVAGGADFTVGLQYVHLRANSSTASGVNEVDNIRVGSTWAEVTPPDDVTSPVTNSQPRITQSFLSAGALILRGTNGQADGVYQVLGSPSIATPMANWNAIATNLFDANGNFDSTNPVSPSDAQRFYRILVGGQFTSLPIAPTITLQPTNLSVTAGQVAVFNTAVSGTAPLAYQWFFNTNTPLVNGTNAAFTVSNAQAGDAGGYSLRVTNLAGSATSEVAVLTVNPETLAPTITNQPQSQIVTAGNGVAFSVGASGTAPLRYQWYFNTNTVLLNATNNAYAIASATTNQTGSYSVVVTNNFGAITSSIVSLTVNEAGSAPDFSMVGFATMSGFSSNGTFQAGGTTGGNAGPIVIVTNVSWLVNYAERSNMALRILIVSNIDCSSLSNHHGGFPAGYPTGEILVNSNKTIYSTNGATISRGTLRIGKAANGKDNIIIRNLKFRDLWVSDPSGNYDTYGWDYIGLEGGSHHVWVDHCDFEQVYDGMVDVVHASDYVTVSWNVFRTQKKCSLIGHSNNNQAEDAGHLNVTFHHNYYVDVEERMPRMRFGNAHVFNLYCENLGGNGIQSTCEAATLVEHSYFYQPQSGSLPTREENGTAAGLPNNGKGFIKVVNSIIVNLPAVDVQFRQFDETNFLFNSPFVGSGPPYAYSLDPVMSVPSIVTNWAGVNKVLSLP